MTECRRRTGVFFGGAGGRRRGRAGAPGGGGVCWVRKGEKNTVKTIYLNTQNAKIFY